MTASQVLSGVVERVVVQNATSGFAVLRVKVPGRNEPITVVGTVVSSSPGLVVRAEGDWQDDPTWGHQFAATRITLLAPASVDGIRAYLASGAIKGVGEALAQRIVEHFGAGLRQVLDETPERLREVPGIGARAAQRITEAWRSEGEARDILLFLESQGIRPARARRILEAYSGRAIEQLLADPYALARDIRGIGFATADLLAEQLGITADAPVRRRAALVEVLRGNAEHGHSAMYLQRAVNEAATLSGQPEAAMAEVVDALRDERRIVERTTEAGTFLLLPELDTAEATIARRLATLAAGPPPWDRAALGDWQAVVRVRLALELSSSQAKALAVILTSKVAILTGGPGTGKTSLVRACVACLESQHVRLALAAPTGRAARRLFESTGHEATTIHRLLEADIQRGFARNANRPLDLDLLILDEVSMIDLPLMEGVVAALPDGAALLLVGDRDQLPPVGPGQVLSDLIGSGRLPVVALTEVFRQAEASGIVKGAHRVINGELPRFGLAETGDCVGIRVRDAADARAKLIELVQHRMPDHFDLDPVADIQILVPVNRGPVGTRDLNRALQQVLNPMPEAAFERFGMRFGVGDKVMQTENDYSREVYNGDLGIIQKIDTAARLLEVRFDDRHVVYGFDSVDQLVSAYAITVHKAQGSEYPAVVLLLLHEHGRMLRRQLLYTAMTRARRLLVVLAQGSALERAVATPEPARLSLLAHRLNTEWTTGPAGERTGPIQRTNP
ncbi:MAG: ATP-dependent RecD-like DNA helicase [Geminicoccaceae bacterium]